MTVKNAEVIRRWNRGGRCIKNNTLSASNDGHTLYSYRTAIARKDHNIGLTFITRDNWSVTTKIHLGLVRRIVSSYVEVPDITISADENLLKIRDEYKKQLGVCKYSISKRNIWQLSFLQTAYNKLFETLWGGIYEEGVEDLKKLWVKRDAKEKRVRENYTVNLERDLRRWVKSKSIMPRTRPGFTDYPLVIRLESIVPLRIRTSHGDRFTAEDIISHKCQNLSSEQLEFINEKVQAYEEPKTA